VDAALASLRKKYSIDDNRIYATGFSNGAHFTYLLWATRPNVFAAFAPVAGRMRDSAIPKVPRPLLHIGGSRDAQVAFADQEAAMRKAVRINGVDGKQKPCGTGLHLIRRRNPGSGDDMDTPGRARVSARHVRAYRDVLLTEQHGLGTRDWDWDWGLGTRNLKEWIEYFDGLGLALPSP
jgi:dienelactone hydrolase